MKLNPVILIGWGLIAALMGAIKSHYGIEHAQHFFSTGYILVALGLASIFSIKD